MRRVGRYILNTMTVLSLVLCVATLLLWNRSYSYGDALSWRGSYEHTPTVTHRQIYLSSGFGGILVYRVQQRVPTVATIGLDPGFQWELGKPPERQTLPPFRVATEGSAGYALFRVIIPHWSLSLVLVVLPVVQLTRIVAKRSGRTPGRCPVCNYDVRATPERCPECGTTAKRQTI